MKNIFAKIITRLQQEPQEGVEMRRSMTFDCSNIAVRTIVEQALREEMSRLERGFLQSK